MRIGRIHNVIAGLIVCFVATLATQTPSRADDSRVPTRTNEQRPLSTERAPRAEGKVTQALGDRGLFYPITPFRLLDTRDNQPAVLGIKGRMLPGTQLSLTVAGNGGLPSADILAVALTLTAVDPQGDGHGRLWPSGVARPNTSVINFRAGQTVANSVQVGVGADGNINLYSHSGLAHYIIDVTGYYAGNGPGAAAYRAFIPSRFFDSRDAPPEPLAGRTRRTFNGSCSTCDGTIVAYVFNLTVTNTTSSGYFSVYPGTSAAAPLTSNLNFVANDTVSSTVITQVDGGGNFSIFNGSNTDAHYIIDDVGFFVRFRSDTAPAGRGWFVPISPVRVADSRAESGPIGLLGPLNPNAPGAFQAMGLLGVPSPDVVFALVQNFTVTPSANQVSGFLVAYGADQPQPATSNANFQANQTSANQAILTISDSNNIAVFTNGRFHVIDDIFGYYTYA